MTLGLLRVTLIGVGFAMACARGSMTSDPEEPREPGVSSIPGHDGDPARQVWTTSPNLDTCEQFRASEAPPHSLFETAAECQAWVARRKCKPGLCFDGCNGVSCDATG